MKNVNKYKYILTYHTNSFGCGVAKFNYMLASYLNCEVKQIFNNYDLKKKILLSIKLNEFDKKDIIKFKKIVSKLNNFDVFFHDYSESKLEKKIVLKANQVICGNKEISNKILKNSRNVQTKIRNLWSPSTIKKQANKNKRIKLLCFGMSHKVQIKKFKKLKKILDNKFKNNYQINISLALHEYKSFDNEYLKPYKLLKNIQKKLNKTLLD